MIQFQYYLYIKRHFLEKFYVKLACLDQEQNYQPKSAVVAMVSWLNIVMTHLYKIFFHTKFAFFEYNSFEGFYKDLEALVILSTILLPIKSPVASGVF